MRVAAEIRRVVQRWEADGGYAYMLTTTVRHGWGDDLAKLRADLMSAWQRFQQGKSWAKFRQSYGVETIRSVEVTHGPNGFHPHIHCLVLTKRPLPGEPNDVDDDDDDDDHARGTVYWFKARWEASVVARMDARHKPDWVHGATLVEAKKCDYLSKMTLEMTDPTAAKTARGEYHRTPWQLLADAYAAECALDEKCAAGAPSRSVAVRVDNPDRALWAAYCGAMKGARFIGYSKGLRALRDEVRAKIEADEAAEKKHATEAFFIWHETWDRVRWVPWFRARMLDCVESGDGGRVKSVLREAEQWARLLAQRRQLLAERRGTAWQANQISLGP